LLTGIVSLLVTAAVACGQGRGNGGSASNQPSGPSAAQPSAAVVAKVGRLAPGFQVATLDGLVLTSADLIAQQKPYILYFFASW
jgi:hypothetical protein